MRSGVNESSRLRDWTKKSIRQTSMRHRFSSSAGSDSQVTRFRASFVSRRSLCRARLRENCGAGLSAEIYLRAERLAAHGQLLDKRRIDIYANPNFLYGNSDTAVLVHRPRLRDDVAVPITRARRQVTGQREVRKRRESDVVRATDSCFEDTAAPHWNSRVSATIVN